MIAILGSAGQVGTAMATLLPNAAALTRDDVDLAHPSKAIGALSDLRPSAVVNCAAYTAVDRAEDEEDLATIVNGEAVGALARFCADRGLPFVTYSTDYVFDGTKDGPWLESDPTSPINAYGRSKAIGESLALSAHPSCLVIRTSWVISGTHPNFVATMLRLNAEGRQVTVVDDQFGNPTIAADLAAATVEALQVGATGVLHVTNGGTTTWYRLARRAIELAAGDTRLLFPCTTADYPTKATRPTNSALASERADRLGIAPLPPWPDSLPLVVAGHRSS